jgi:hypothetical protein
VGYHAEREPVTWNAAKRHFRQARAMVWAVLGPGVHRCHDAYPRAIRETRHQGDAPAQFST